MQHVYDANSFLRVAFEGGKSTQDLAMELYSRHSVGDRVIWAQDGENANLSRRAILPEYKMRDRNEDRMKDFYRFCKFFTKAYLPLLGFTYIRINGYEADDIIRLIAGSTNKPTTIHTTDQDLYELTVNPMVTWKSIYSYNLGCEAKDIRLFKTLSGDKSDKIAGILGFGIKTFLKLTEEEKAELCRCLEAKVDEPPELPSLGTTAKAKALKEQWKNLWAYWVVTGAFLPSIEEFRNHLVPYARAASFNAILEVPNHGGYVEEILNGD